MGCATGVIHQVEVIQQSRPRLTVVQGGLDLVVLDDKMNVTSSHKAGVIRVPTTYPHPDFAFAKEGKLLASLVDGADGVIRLFLFDAEDSAFMTISRGDRTPPPWAISLAPDGRKLAACGPGGQLRVWDVQEGGAGRRLADDHVKPTDLKYVVFGDDPDDLVTSGDDGSVRIWRVSTGRAVFSARGPSRDVRAGSLRQGVLTLVSGGYRFTAGSPEPLVIETIKVEPNMVLP